MATSTEIEGLLIKNQKDLQRQNNILRLPTFSILLDSFEKVTNLDFRKLYKSAWVLIRQRLIEHIA